MDRRVRVVEGIEDDGELLQVDGEALNGDTDVKGGRKKNKG